MKRYNHPIAVRDIDAVVSPAGAGEKVVYRSRYSPSGEIEIVEDGKEDLYAYIQSFKDSVDINVILARFRSGDISALSRTQGVFGDFSGMPTTYAEMLNRINDAKQYFEDLPLDVKSRFGQDYNRFIAAMDSPGFWASLKPSDDAGSFKSANGVADFDRVRSSPDSSPASLPTSSPASSD